MTSRDNRAVGTEGETVTVANSAAGGAPFDEVTCDSGGVVTYKAIGGTLAYCIDTTGAPLLDASNAKLLWYGGDTVRRAGRMEIYLPSPGVPPEDAFHQWLRLDETILAWTLGYDWLDYERTTDGPTPTAFKVEELGVGDEPYIWNPPTGTLPLDTWFRFEWDVDYGADSETPGSYDFRLYADTTTSTPLAQLQGARTWQSGHGTGTVEFGARFGASTLFYINNLNINDVGAPGPATDAEGWMDLPGKTSGVLSFRAKLTDDGTHYRAKYSSSQGIVYSEPATLTVTPGPADPGGGTSPPTPDVGGDFPDPSLPDAIAPADTDAGTDTVLNLLRRFSADVRRPVRFTGPNSVEMVDINAPLPTGIVQADADAMYHSTARTAQAGEKTLSLEAADLSLSATAELTADDVRLIVSDWQLPGQLPVWGLRPAPVSRVSYTFTPKDFHGSVDFVYPVPLTVVRRA